MRYSVFMIRFVTITLIAFAAGAILIWPAELLAVGAAVRDTVLGTYMVRFVDAATWLAGCF